MRRTLCWLTAPMAQNRAVALAARRGIDINHSTAQRIVNAHTSWPFGSVLHVERQLTEFFEGTK
jgi:hypothetical protein